MHHPAIWSCQNLPPQTSTFHSLVADTPLPPAACHAKNFRANPLPSETEQAILPEVSSVNNLNVIPQEWKKADLLVYRDPEPCQRTPLETDD
jgi:hypothetical protein